MSHWLILFRKSPWIVTRDSHLNIWLFLENRKNESVTQNLIFFTDQFINKLSTAQNWFNSSQLTSLISTPKELPRLSWKQRTRDGILQSRYPSREDHGGLWVWYSAGFQKRPVVSRDDPWRKRLCEEGDGPERKPLLLQIQTREKTPTSEMGYPWSSELLLELCHRSWGKQV